MSVPVSLLCHPDTPSAAVRAIEVHVARDAAGIVLRFRLEGDLSRLRLPPAAPPGRADRLWEHTCFEAFVAPPAGSAYVEFNFAPSGQWAVYRFEAYRQGGPVDPAGAPRIAVRRSGDALEIDVAARLDGLRLPARGALRLGLSAVIEEGQAVSYWALGHAPGKPDFHRPDAFALELAGESAPAEGMQDR